MKQQRLTFGGFTRRLPHSFCYQITTIKSNLRPLESGQKCILLLSLFVKRHSFNKTYRSKEKSTLRWQMYILISAGGVLESNGRRIYLSSNAMFQLYVSSSSFLRNRRSFSIVESCHDPRKPSRCFGCVHRS